MYKIIFIFMIYGFIGWCWETPFVSIQEKTFVNRGFLHGPIIPIYAFGAMIIIGSSVLIKTSLNIQSFQEDIIIIFHSGLMASLLEYITSYILEKAFHTRWWDYTHKKFNLKGRICLLYSIGWGFIGFAAIKWIHPLVIKFIDIIPKDIGRVILIVFVSFFSVDLFFTLKDLISLRSIMQDLLIIKLEIKEKLYEAIETKQGIKDKFYEAIEIKQENALKRYNMLLEKSKKYSRFYRIYPKAYSKRFKELIDTVRANKIIK